MEVRQDLEEESLVVRECRGLCGGIGVDYEGEFADNTRFITQVRRLIYTGNFGKPCTPSLRSLLNEHPSLSQPRNQNNLP